MPTGILKIHCETNVQFFLHIITTLIYTQNKQAHRKKQNFLSKKNEKTSVKNDNGT